MFYEEKVIDGILMCRATPDGLWQSVSLEVMTDRLVRAEAFVSHHHLKSFPTEELSPWQPIETAPKTGAVKTLLLYVPTLHGTGGPALGHWAHGGGEDQPRFGPDWFFWSGYDFRALTEKPTHWMPLPRCPADWRSVRSPQAIKSEEGA